LEVKEEGERARESVFRILEERSHTQRTGKKNPKKKERSPKRNKKKRNRGETKKENGAVLEEGLTATTAFP